MTDDIFAFFLTRIIRLLAGDPSRWLNFRRQLLKVIRSDDPEQSRKGALAIAEQLERVYNMPEGKTTVPLEFFDDDFYTRPNFTAEEIASGEWQKLAAKSE